LLDSRLDKNEIISAPGIARRLSPFIVIFKDALEVAMEARMERFGCSETTAFMRFS
jgi:hypothetical protein